MWMQGKSYRCLLYWIARDRRKHIGLHLEKLQAYWLEKPEKISGRYLGAEALRRLEVENFPVVAVIDSEGNNLYEKGRREYLETVDANGNA